MMECKAMATPMASNLKLLCDASLETVDATIYRQIIGSLMYLMNTRLDICFAMNTLSQFLTDLRHVHLIAGKHILRYPKGIVDYGLKHEARLMLCYEHLKPIPDGSETCSLDYYKAYIEVPEGYS